MPFDYREEYQRYQRYYLNLQRFYQQPVARVSVFVVMSFMTVSFFSVFAIRPTLITISNLIREIEDKREVNSQLDQKVAGLSRVQAEYSQVKADLPRVWRAMPDKPEVASVIWQLELAAVRNGLKLINLQVEPVTLTATKAETTKGKELPKIEVGVTVGGNLTQVKAFMTAVNNLGRVMVVKEATWATATPVLQKEGLALTVSLRGEVYFTKEADAG
jgi:Tfp pilus assembly protein PilO